MRSNTNSSLFQKPPQTCKKEIIVIYDNGASSKHICQITFLKHRDGNNSKDILAYGQHDYQQTVFICNMKNWKVAEPKLFYFSCYKRQYSIVISKRVCLDLEPNYDFKYNPRQWWHLTHTIFRCSLTRKHTTIPLLPLPYYRVIIYFWPILVVSYYSPVTGLADVG